VAGVPPRRSRQEQMVACGLAKGPRASIKPAGPSGDRRGRVAVNDTGKEIPEAERPDIFDPLTTTSPVGQGIGLGLSSAPEIFQRHGWLVGVESNGGTGSTVTV